MSPNDKEAPTWLAYVCLLHSKLAQWEQAIERCDYAEKANAGGGGWSGWRTRALANLAAAYAGAGRMREARVTIERLRIVDPHFTALTYQTIIDNRLNPTYQAQTTRVLERHAQGRAAGGMKVCFASEEVGRPLTVDGGTEAGRIGTSADADCVPPELRAGSNIGQSGRSALTAHSGPSFAGHGDERGPSPISIAYGAAADQRRVRLCHENGGAFLFGG